MSSFFLSVGFEKYVFQISDCSISLADVRNVKIWRLTNSRGKTLSRVRGPSKDCHSSFGAATLGATQIGRLGNYTVNQISKESPYCNP